MGDMCTSDLARICDSTPTCIIAEFRSFETLLQPTWLKYVFLYELVTSKNLALLRSGTNYADASNKACDASIEAHEFIDAETREGWGIHSNRDIVPIAKFPAKKSPAHFAHTSRFHI